MLSRRSLLTGLIAAPAVIRVAPLMRIAPLPEDRHAEIMRLLLHSNEYLAQLDRYFEEVVLYGSSIVRVGEFEGLIRYG